MKQILFFASLLFVFASCTKSSTSTVENSEILRSGKWRTTAFTVKFEVRPGVDSVYDIHLKDTCRFDDYLTFEDNFKGTQHSGKDKCGGELDEIPFDWKLIDNQKVLVLNNAQYTIGHTDKIPVTPVGKEYAEAKIIKMNKKSMTLTYQTTVQAFIPATTFTPASYKEITYYFTHVFEK